MWRFSSYLLTGYFLPPRKFSSYLLGRPSSRPNAHTASKFGLSLRKVGAFGYRDATILSYRSNGPLVAISNAYVDKAFFLQCPDVRPNLPIT